MRNDTKEAAQRESFARLQDTQQRLADLETKEYPTATDIVRRDGTTPLTAEWDIGEDMAIRAERLEARDAEGLRLEDDGGNLGIYVEDATGHVGIGVATALSNDIVGTFDYGGNPKILRTDGIDVRHILRGSTSAAIDLIDTGASVNAKWMQLIADGDKFTIRSVTDAGGLQVANILVLDNLTGYIGILNATPGYALDIKVNAIRSQMHFSGTNADSGGYMVSASANNFFMMGGAHFDTPNWIAKSTSAGIFGTQLGHFDWFADTGLTAGNNFTPTQVAYLDQTGLVVGNSASPQAKLHGLQATLGNAVERLESTATNDNPTETVYQNRVATTDATVTTLHTFTVPASTTYAIEARVIARRTGGAAGTAEDGAYYIINGVYKNVAGTATIIGAVVQTVVGESVAGYDATFDVTGATVRCRVTGVLNTNITWHMTSRAWLVST